MRGMENRVEVPVEAPGPLPPHAGCASRRDPGSRAGSARARHPARAWVLGVQRSTVSLVIRTLQNAGLITQSRSAITVRDCFGLEDAACECHGIIRRKFERLLPNKDYALLLCRSPRVKGKARCRMHGGALGSRAPKGRRNGSYKHGQFTCEALGERRVLRGLIAASRETLEAL
jgi:hypothetical protein